MWAASKVFEGGRMVGKPLLEQLPIQPTIPLVPSTALAHTDADARTPLAIASEFHHEELVSLLLDVNAPPDSVDRHGETPLMVAAAAGDRNVVSHLLSAKADAGAR